MSNVSPIYPVIRIWADVDGAGAEVSIVATDDDLDVCSYEPTFVLAMAQAVAKFRSHRRWLRRQRETVAVSLTKNVENDPTVVFARQLQAEIAEARADIANRATRLDQIERHLSAVAPRFRVDAPKEAA